MQLLQSTSVILTNLWHYFYATTPFTFSPSPSPASSPQNSKIACRKSSLANWRKGKTIGGAEVFPLPPDLRPHSLAGGILNLYLIDRLRRSITPVAKLVTETSSRCTCKQKKVSGRSLLYAETLLNGFIISEHQ